MARGPRAALRRAALAPAGRGIWRGSLVARRRRAGARASERASRRAGGRVRRVLAAEEWRLGGSDSLTPARPDQSRLRERAGGREEEGEAEWLSPGRGAGRDPASAAPGPPDRGRGTPLARPLVRPRGRARRQPGKTKQTRTQLSPPPRPRPPLGALDPAGAGAGRDGDGALLAWGGPGIPPTPMMAPPGRCAERTCHLLVPSPQPAGQGSAGTPLASLWGLRWRSLAPRPWPPRDLPGHRHPLSLLLRTLPVSLPPSAPRPRPVRAAHCIPPARATLAGAGRRPPALPLMRGAPGGAGLAGGGHPVPRAPSASRAGPLLRPSEALGGRGKGKFVPKFPLIYSKIWRRRVIFFPPSSAYTPLRL